jgi:hypothetical protein
MLHSSKEYFHNVSAILFEAAIYRIAFAEDSLVGADICFVNSGVGVVGHHVLRTNAWGSPNSLACEVLEVP